MRCLRHIIGGTATICLEALECSFDCPALQHCCACQGTRHAPTRLRQADRKTNPSSHSNLQ